MNLTEYQRDVLSLKNSLFRYALSIVQQRETAQDVTQEALIRAWEERKKLSQVDSIEAWCLVVVRNKALNWLRKRKRSKLVDLHDYHDLKDKGKSPLQKTEESDAMHQLSSIISELPQMQREVIQLRDIEQLSYKEVAEVMDIGLDHVKVLLHRARKKIKIEMTKVYDHGITQAQ